jgi:hypothetical protein
MRPATLVMISCSSSSGSDGCRRVIMSFWTHSFSCGGTTLLAAAPASVGPPPTMDTQHYSAHLKPPSPRPRSRAGRRGTSGFP